MDHKQQQRNGVFCAVCANGFTHNIGIHNDTAKQQLHCNRETVFSVWSVLRCYKLDS
jgi:hypothetical protein